MSSTISIAAEPQVSPLAVQLALIGALGVLLGAVGKWVQQVLRESRERKVAKRVADAERESEVRQLKEQQDREARGMLLEQCRSAYAAFLSAGVELQKVKYDLLETVEDIESVERTDLVFSAMTRPFFNLSKAASLVELVTQSADVDKALEKVLFDALFVTGHGDAEWMRDCLKTFDKAQLAFATAAGRDLRDSEGEPEGVVSRAVR